MSSNDKNRRLYAPGLQLLHKLQAVHAGQPKIRNDEIGHAGQRNGLFSACRTVCVEPCRFEMQLDHPPKLVFIFNNKYSSGRHNLNLLSFGQRNFKGCARPSFAEHVYPALMLVDDFRYDRKPQPGSMRLCRKKWIENAFEVLRLYTFAVIAN